MIAKSVGGDLYLGQVAVLTAVVDTGSFSDAVIAAISAAGVCRVVCAVDGCLTAVCIIFISVSFKHGYSPFNNEVFLTSGLD